MSVLNKIWDSGWGALFLSLYSLGVLYVLFPELDYAVLAIGAAAPSLVLILLISSFNDWLMKRLAGDTIRESFSGIKDRIGEDEEFYWDQETDIRETIDDLDRRAHEKVVMIFAGGIIAVTLPVFAWYQYGLREAVVGVVIAVVILYLLSYRPYFDLQEVIKSSAKIYGAKNED